MHMQGADSKPDQKPAAQPQQKEKPPTIPQARDLFNVLDEGPMNGASNLTDPPSSKDMGGQSKSFMADFGDIGDIPLIGEGLIDDPSAGKKQVPP